MRVNEIIWKGHVDLSSKDLEQASTREWEMGHQQKAIKVAYALKNTQSLF